MATIQLLNRRPYSRKSYTTCGVPFSQGQLFENDSLVVNQATDRTERVQWYPQGPRYLDGSVKYARCTFPVDIDASASKQCEIIKGSTSNAPGTHNFNANVNYNINNSKFALRIRPKWPQKPVAKITNVTYVSSNLILLTLDRDIFSEAGGANRASIRFRIEGLTGTWEPVNSTGTSTYITSNNRRVDQNSGNSFLPNNQIYLQTSIAGNPSFTPSNHPNHEVRFDWWNFTTDQYRELSFKLNDPEWITVEGSANEHYERKRLFKRFAHDPADPISMNIIYMEVILDEFGIRDSADDPEWRLWLKIGCSNFRFGYGNATQDTSPMQYRYTSFFFEDEILFEVSPEDGRVASLSLNFRKSNKECYDIRGNTGNLGGTFALDGQIHPRNGNNTLPNTSTFQLDTMYCYAGCIQNNVLTSNLRANFGSSFSDPGEEILSVATNWVDPGMWPPFGHVPDSPTNLPTRAQQITATDALAARWEADIFDYAPYQQNSAPVIGATRPSQAGAQGVTFIGCASVPVLRPAWPSLLPAMAFWFRREGFRPIWKMNWDGSPWIAEDYHNNPNGFASFTSRRQEREPKANDVGGLGRNEWTNDRNPENALLGPDVIQRNTLKRNIEFKKFRNYKNGAVPSDSLQGYAKSHFVLPWLTSHALITMDWLSLDMCEHYAESWQSDHWIDARTESIFKGKVFTREAWRPLHTANYLFHVTGNMRLLNNVVNKFYTTEEAPLTSSQGRSSGPLGYYQASAAREVNELFPAADYLTKYRFFQGRSGPDPRALATVLHEQTWLTAFMVRGAEGLARTLETHTTGAYYSGVTVNGITPNDLPEKEAAVSGFRQSAMDGSASFVLHGYQDLNPGGDQQRCVFTDTVVSTSTGPAQGITRARDLPTGTYVLDLKNGDQFAQGFGANFTGYLWHYKRFDGTNYTFPNDPFPKDTKRNAGDPFRFTYEVFFTGTNGNVINPNFPVTNMRTMQSFGLDEVVGGYRPLYDVHCGFNDEIFAAGAGGSQFVTGDLAIGEVITEPFLSEYNSGSHYTQAETDQYPELSGLSTILYTNRNIKPLESPTLKYLRWGKSTINWTYQCLPFALEYARNGHLPFNNSEVLAAAERTVDRTYQFAYDPGSDWDFSTDPYIRLLPSIVERNDVNVFPSTLNIFVGSPDPTVLSDGEAPQSIVVTPGTLSAFAATNQPQVTTTQNQGGGQVNVQVKIDNPPTVFFSTSKAVPVTQNLEVLNTVVTPETLVNFFSINSPTVFTQINTTPESPFVWTRFLELGMNLEDLPSALGAITDPANTLEEQIQEEIIELDQIFDIIVTFELSRNEEFNADTFRETFDATPLIGRYPPTDATSTEEQVIVAYLNLIEEPIIDSELE